MWSSTNAAMKVRGLAEVEVEAGAVFFFFDSTIFRPRRFSLPLSPVKSMIKVHSTQIWKMHSQVKKETSSFCLFTFDFYSNLFLKKNLGELKLNMLVICKTKTNFSKFNLQ